MSSVVRFDLLNHTLQEPVDINPCRVNAFPAVKRLLLAPSQKGATSAFVEMEGIAESNHENAEEFMSWVCWLLSLAELHHVYYWGAHRFVRTAESNWTWKTSSWKKKRVKEWVPSGPLAAGPSVFEGSVWHWRLPQFLSIGLTRFSDSSFPRKDFIMALHLFIDSLHY